MIGLSVTWTGAVGHCTPVGVAWNDFAPVATKKMRATMIPKIFENIFFADLLGGIIL